MLDLAIMPLAHLPHLHLSITTLAISIILLPLNTHLPSSFSSITAYSFPILFFPSPPLLHCHQLKPPSSFILNSTSLVQASLSILSKIFPPPVLILEVCWYHHYSTFTMHCLMSKVLVSKSCRLLACKLFKDVDYVTLL